MSKMPDMTVKERKEFEKQAHNWLEQQRFLIEENDELVLHMSTLIKNFKKRIVLMKAQTKEVIRSSNHYIKEYKLKETMKGDKNVRTTITP